MSQFQNPMQSMQQEDSDLTSGTSSNPSVDIGQQMSSGGRPVWDTTDALMAAPRGIVGAVQGIYNTADWLTADSLPDWKTNPLGESRSIVGGLLEGLVEFSALFIPGMNIAEGVGAAAQAGKLGGTAAKALGWMAKAEKGAEEARTFASVASGVAKSAAKATVVGAGTDFLLATPGQQRLSNLAIQFDSPWLNNDVTQFLASGEGEGQLEARLKRAAEGVLIGVPVNTVVDGIMAGIKAVRFGRVAAENVRANGGTPEEALDAATKAEASYASENVESIHEASGVLYSKGSSNAESASVSAVDNPLEAEKVRAVSDQEPLNKPLSSSPRLVSELQKELSVSTGTTAAKYVSTARELDGIPTEAIDKIRKSSEEIRKWGDHEDPEFPDELRNNANNILRENGIDPNKLTKEQNNALWDVIHGDERSEDKASRLSSDAAAHVSERNARISEMTTNPDKFTVGDAWSMLPGASRTDALASEVGIRVKMLGLKFGGKPSEVLTQIAEHPDVNDGTKAVARFLLEHSDVLDKYVTGVKEEPPVPGYKGVHSASGRNADLRNPTTPFIGVFEGHWSGVDDLAQVTVHEAVHAATWAKIQLAIMDAGAAVGGGTVDESRATAAMSWNALHGSGASLTKRSFSDDYINQIIGNIKDKNVKDLILLYQEAARQTKTAQLPRELPNGFTDAKTYGFTNLDEFIAEAFTNPEFQRTLSGMQVPRTKKNLFTSIVDAIGKILGLEDLYGTITKSAGIVNSPDQNVLESVIRNGAELIAGKSAPASGGSAGRGSLAEASLHARSNYSLPDSSMAGRGNPRSGETPIPNQPRPDANDFRVQVDDIIKRVRGNPGGWTPSDLGELNNLVEETTRSGLLNTGFGAKHGNTAGEFILGFAELVSQNRDLYEGIKQIKSNAETAENRNAFLSVMDNIGGLNPEQRIRFAQTISNWHGPMFEDGAAIVSAMVGSQMNLYLDAIKRGASSSEREALFEGLKTMAAADRKNANIIGRSLQNRKMMWKEELAAKISTMTPQEVNDRLKDLQEFVKVGVIDKDTWFQIRDNALGSGYRDHALWAYKNSVLSGPATSSAVAISNSASWLYLPLERAIGYGIDGLFSAENKGKATRELAVYGQLPCVINDVWNAARLSWKQEGESITLGSTSSPYGEFVPRNRFKPRAGADVFTTALDYAVWGTGQAVGLGGVPQRIIGATHEIFSAAGARANMRSLLISEAPASIKSDPQRLAQYVSDKMKQAFNDVGALHSEDAVRGQVMREAKAAGFEPGSPEWTAYVQNKMAQRWVAPQGQDRLDAIYMDRVAATVRRRTEQQTFRRDYTDILEESHPLALGTRTLAGLGRNATGLIRDVPALGFLMPFVKTPTNLLIWAVERNPIEASLNLSKHIDDPDMRGEMIGRLSTGLLMYGVAISAALSGAITGRGPSDANARKALMDSGWQQNSIKVGDRYVSYSRFEPFSGILGLMGDAVDIAKQKYLSEQEQASMIDMTAKVVVGSIANNMVNKTYLTGLRNLLDAITNWDAKGQAFIGGLAGGIIPNALTQPYVHYQDDIAAPREIMDRIMARIPGYGGTIDKRRNALGEAMDNPADLWNLALPVRVTKQSTDPVKNELAKLMVGFSGPSPTLDGGIDLTSMRSKSGQSAFDRYQELTSQVQVGGKTLKERLAQIIGTSQYQAMPETSVDGIQTTRVGMLRGEIGRYRRAALQRLQEEFPDIQNRLQTVDNIKMQMRRGF